VAFIIFNNYKPCFCSSIEFAFKRIVRSTFKTAKVARADWKTADLAALSLQWQAERLQVTHVSNGRWGSATKCAIPTDSLRRALRTTLRHSTPPKTQLLPPTSSHFGQSKLMTPDD